MEKHTLPGLLTERDEDWSRSFSSHKRTYLSVNAVEVTKPVVAQENF